MNKWMGIGRLTKEIELKYDAAGKASTFFAIAVRKNAKEANFISCIAWGQTAENMKKYLKKGSQIGIEGELNTFSKKTEDGFLNVFNIAVFRVNFLDSNQSETKTQHPNPPAEEEKPMEFSKTTSSFNNTEEVNANDIDLGEIKF